MSELDQLRTQIEQLQQQLRPIASVSEIAKLFSAGFDGSKPQELRHFVDNVDNAFSMVTGPQERLLIKYVLSKITGDAKRLLNNSDVPIEEVTWDLVKQKLETHYAVRRTFYYYVQEISTSRQREKEPIHAWGNRIEKILSNMMEVMPTITRGWNADKKDGAIDIMVHIGKQMFVQGVQNEEIRQTIKPMVGQLTTAGLIDRAVQEESEILSRQRRSYKDSQGVGNKTQYQPKIKQERMVNTIVCFKCQKQGHMARECRNVPKCGNCSKLGHETRDCRSQSNGSGNSKSSLSSNQGK